ncbi:hypothetical protein PHYSODRAFT_295194 [Phytophthora sojae]|uniref:Uncharacterized protein n=1 Tax=Phytophthora sojae (strain P6497) TaxID=1094619 RepID=G4YNI5_PHYSP|nr:hypothetical protein PHYSODRAFT_295194 [Phytophthora sojae]EGZ30384.1 hypothetical protein PHYSODRAFT_295194 [Phytophthora sojae]|eukprot:XP_009517659.1 hypothetical protein PHYSODRAFT_295194 [Phytophthora sojae]
MHCLRGLRAIRDLHLAREQCHRATGFRLNSTVGLGQIRASRRLARWSQNRIPVKTGTHLNAAREEPPANRIEKVIGGAENRWQASSVRLARARLNNSAGSLDRKPWTPQNSSRTRAEVFGSVGATNARRAIASRSQAPRVSRTAALCRSRSGGTSTSAKIALSSPRSVDQAVCACCTTRSSQPKQLQVAAKALAA